MDKLRAIEYFMKVAECGSIVNAAHALDVTASAVSKMLAAFEAELGFSLFHRTTRRLSLTVDGADYLESCREILHDLEEAETRRRQQRRNPSGTVKVAMHPAFRALFFAEIARLLNRYPELRVETRISNSPDVLFDEGFDLLIRGGNLPDSSLVARPIGQLDFVFAASHEYLKRFGEPKTPAELAHHRWVLPTRIDNYLGSSAHWVFSKGQESEAVTVQSYVTSRDSVGVLESVIGGSGIAGLYTVSVLPAIQQGLLKPVLTHWTVPGRPSFAVFPNKRAITPKTLTMVKFFSEFIVRAAKQFPRR